MRTKFSVRSEEIMVRKKKRNLKIEVMIYNEVWKEEKGNRGIKEKERRTKSDGGIADKNGRKVSNHFEMGNTKQKIKLKGVV